MLRAFAADAIAGFSLHRCCRDCFTQISLLPSGTAATTALRADKTQLKILHLVSDKKRTSCSIKSHADDQFSFLITVKGCSINSDFGMLLQIEVSFRLLLVFCGVFLSSFSVTQLAMRPQMLTKIHSHKIQNQSDIIYRTPLKPLFVRTDNKTKS